jgi:hypothetical protein
MINPALFIGLGSTGVRILEHLQKLVLEEYGSATLPIFKYLAIETDEGKKIEIPSWAENEIELIHPVIRNTLAIKDELKRGRKEYLRNWLNEKLLDIPGSRFTAGASSIRMAGRLCLWENWSSGVNILNALVTAKNQITATPNVDKTNTFLREYYARVGKQVAPNQALVGSLPNVYIVGTLCGGTCGGMFIDIAYYVRHLFGLWARSVTDHVTAKVMGIFTIHDASILNVAPTEEHKRQAANCWASLIEMDYYHHPDSMYDITFPDGTRVRTNEPPFNYTYLLSCSGMGPDLHTEKGEPDVDALNHMVAMNLFSETVSDLLAAKERIIVDGLAAPDIYRTNQNEHSCFLASCGIATVWYPKYRIAEAAACLEGKRLCEQWLGSIDADEKDRIKKEAKRIWEQTLINTLPILTHKPGGSIEGDIKLWFDDNKSRLLNETSENMTKELKKQIEKLKEEDEYDHHISEESRQTQFKDRIWSSLKETIYGEIDRTHNLSYARFLLEELDKNLEDTINSCPSKYPQYNLSKITGDVVPDIWSRLVMMEREVSQQKREEFLKSSQEYLLGMIEKIRNFRTRFTLEELRKDLGVRYQASSKKAKRKQTLNQELEKLITHLDNCRDRFTKRAQEMGEEIETTQDVIVIVDNINEDVNLLSAELADLSPNERERKIMMTEDGTPQTLHQFLNRGEDEIFSSIITVLRRKALECRARVNIAQEILQKLDHPTLCLFARRSLPHLQLAGNLISVRNPEFIVGRDEAGSPNLLQLQKELGKSGAKDKINFSQEALISTPLIDHLLLFYKEQKSLYMDENLATSELFEQRYKEMTEKAIEGMRHQEKRYYGLHTHKNERIEFDVKIAIRKEKARELMYIARDLFSKRDSKGNWVESEIFRVVSGTLRLEFKASDGTDVVLLGDESGIEILARDEFNLKYFEDNIKNKINEIGLNGFIERVNAYLKWEEQRALDEGKTPQEAVEIRQREKDRYDEIKEKYFPSAKKG